MQKQLFTKKCFDMKLVRTFLFGLAATALILASGCKKDEDQNVVTINIISPVDGSVVADASQVLIHIEFEATDENEEIDVLIHRDGDESDVAFEWDTHDHDKKIVLMETIDLSSYPSGTKFLMEIDACEDHDCKRKSHKHITFSIP